MVKVRGMSEFVLKLFLNFILFFKLSAALARHTASIAICGAHCLDTYTALTLTKLGLVGFSDICKFAFQTVYLIC